MAKFLDNAGLTYFWGKLNTILGTKVDKVDGKGLSTNDFTTEEKTKLEGIATGAEVNVLEGVTVNGTAATITNKIAAITVPTKVSELTNDGDGTTGSKFATEDYVDTNGGKIDKIKVNGVEQTISTVDKSVDISVPVIDSTITSGGTNAVQGGAIYTALAAKLDSTEAESTYAKKTDITGVYKYKGSVANYEALPASGNTNGDVYDTLDTGKNYAWDGTKWDDLGGTFSIDAITNSEIDTIMAS